MVILCCFCVRFAWLWCFVCVVLVLLSSLCCGVLLRFVVVLVVRPSALVFLSCLCLGVVVRLCRGCIAFVFVSCGYVSVAFLCCFRDVSVSR